MTLPKGGGAIQGMGEKFAANPVNGSGSMTLPIALPQGRAGFSPSLSLSYDSGAGNGPFGLGWQLSLPSITRKTDKGLPQYLDELDSDTFILSGREDLVPELTRSGSAWSETRLPDRTLAGRTYELRAYRPRIEDVFARIERWTNANDPKDVFWRSISADNVTAWYGRTANSRIADPANPSRIFSWLIDESRDDKGSAIRYEYLPEDARKVALESISEEHRNDSPSSRTANRYLKRVLYGNRVSHLVTPDLTNSSWLFEIVFDYGEDHILEKAPLPDGNVVVAAQLKPPGPWPARLDPFSSYRSGFEVRTYRLCRRVLTFHHFDELTAQTGSSGYLTRSLDFEYDEGRVLSVLKSATSNGYVWRSADKQYLKRSLPPTEFEYSQVPSPTELAQAPRRELDPASLENLPTGLMGGQYQWLDLDGEGLSGVLAQSEGAWYYKPNLGGGHFGGLVRLPSQPSTARLGGTQQLLDLAGDGQLDVVEFDAVAPGYYERTDEREWAPYRKFVQSLRLNLRDRNVQFVDLDGDGRADVMLTEQDAITWYPSLGEEGFAAARRVPLPLDEAVGPRIVFSDGTQTVMLADMSGDGLSDLCRIRNGEICYWPNLGYGHFGARVTMENSPWLDSAEQFDPQRVRTVDIDGTGVTDIVYLGSDGVRVYYNEAGNRWSDAQALPQIPRIDNLSSVSVVDLFGNGTACLVWSSSAPARSGRALCYIDLMGGIKPHLLIKSVNNLGAETRVEYASSTKFYLEDRAAQKPWITRLPFPVHVVTRVQTSDLISGNRFVSSYKYHHGFFDGAEREFRGFGMVEQQDSEQFATFAGAGNSVPATNWDAESHVPPVLTRTWFHTGVYLARDRVSNYLAHEYFREAGLTSAEAERELLPDTVLPEGLDTGEEREACRALKGVMLRQEIYALDPSSKAGIPYSVTEQNFDVRMLQPRGNSRHAVFKQYPREMLSHHYERNVADPRTTHAFTLEADVFGNVLKSLSVANGRRVAANDPALDADDIARQSKTLITFTEAAYTENDLGSAAQAADHFRAPLPAETRTHELTGFSPEVGAHFSFDEWTRNGFALLKSATDVAYESTPDTTKKQRRLIEHLRTRYRKDNLTDLSPLKKVEAKAVRGEEYKLAFTPSLIASTFVRPSNGSPAENLLPAPNVLLPGAGEDQGGYVAMDGGWWIPSGRVFFSAVANTSNPQITAAAELSAAQAQFYAPRIVTDPFGRATKIEYDPYNLLVARTIDAVGNSTAASNDYRVLQPFLITDPNRNRSEVEFDALGMVTATAVMGKSSESSGDRLEDFTADPLLADLRRFIANPAGMAASMLGRATSRVVYDLDRFRRIGQPPCAVTLARATHFEPKRDGVTSIQIAFSYSDGFAREIQKKAQAEKGDAPQRQPAVPDTSGDIAPAALSRDAMGKIIQADTPKRWVGSGRVVLNNKGKPVKQYEPFFSSTHLYENEAELTDTGVSPVLFYDPLGRTIATLHPNDTYEKVVFDAWQQTTFDVNDTVAANGGETGNPRTDPDIKSYVERFFAAQPANWRTWHAQRMAGPAQPEERDAARKAEAHANTPTTGFLDAMGRVYVSVAHNRFLRNGTVVDEKYATRFDLDIEGNQRAVRDALARVVMRYAYDMLGNRIFQASMDAGERWMLADALGKPIRAWDSRGHMRRLTYDAMRRPTGMFVALAGAERLAERTEYGEGQGDARNHLGRVFKAYDAAGVVENIGYDFKGNLVESRRNLLSSYKGAVNWQQNPVPTDGPFTNKYEHDALNRAIAATSPDGSIYRPTFNEANLLDKVDVNLRGAAATTPFVTNIEYDSKGQRTRIEYGNGAFSDYKYDENTYRLTGLKTSRPAGLNGTASQLFNDARVVQDLRYWHDPAGNITRIEDASLKTVIVGGQTVVPAAAYTYDAIYRLIDVSGREHGGQSAFDFAPSNGDFRDYPFFGHRASPADLQALRTYTQSFDYDPVGNCTTMAHRAGGAGWTRRYEYKEPSLVEPGKTNNRLSRTTLGDSVNRVEVYTHDVHGNMTSMPHLAAMAWDFKDQLNSADLGGGGRAWYVYDSAGQRVRKVIESQDGTRRKERLYLGGFEVYREYAANGTTIDAVRESLHVVDDKQRIALVETQTINGGLPVAAPKGLRRYQLGNHLNSASVELDEAGALISYEEYHPFGTTSLQAGRSAAELGSKRFRYIAKERDDETGFNYHGVRLLVPWLGRWTSADPLYVKDSTNVYLYALNNPLIAKDSNGGLVWLIPVGVYLGYKALSSAGETAVEAGIAKVTGDEKFSPGWSFAKNFGVNIAVGLIPGATEAKISVKVGIYGAKLGLRTTADAALDTALGKGSLTENLVTSGLGNLGGDALGAGIGKVVKKFSSNAAKKVAKSAADEAAEKATKEAAEKAAKDAAEKAAKAKDAAEKAAKRAAEKAATDAVEETGIAAEKSFFEGTHYTKKVLKQMKGGAGELHSFPESVTAFEKSGVLKTITGGDGIVREMLEIPGEYSGRKGVFQFIKEADGAINHRLFKERP